MRGTFRLDVPLLIHGELLVKKEILRRQLHRRVQAKP
jgi:hypothetical protein